jgi:hypothetical protein
VEPNKEESDEWQKIARFICCENMIEYAMGERATW